MIFTIRRASGNWVDPNAVPPRGPREVNVNTIEDLVALQKEYGSPIVVGGLMGWSNSDELLVYDDYIE